ncbi:hypothetical protein [Parasphingorhabdus pacifica]
MDDWVLNEDDERAAWEEPEPDKTSDIDSADEDALTGQDAGGNVTVYVTESAEVVTVKLADDWKRLVESGAFDACVVEAANAATMHALANRLETGEGASSATEQPEPDVSHYGKNDVARVLDAVTADLQNFSQRMSAVVDQPASASSSGGHVNGSAQRGKILTVSTDGDWLVSVRKSEIEGEILDVLQDLGKQISPGELAEGPSSPAISELNALVRDPQKLLRAVGLPSQ